MDTNPLVLVKQIMTGPGSSLAPDLAIEEALSAMAQEGYPGAPVIQGERIVGMLCQIDLVRVLAEAAYHVRPSGTVADHMTQSVDALSPDQDVFKAAQTFLDTGHPWLPVVDSHGAFVGRVSLGDLCTALSETAVPDQAPEHPPGAAWDPEASVERDLEP